jgi:HAD superfamily hydrolase (TIGR01509 family)
MHLAQKATKVQKFRRGPLQAVLFDCDGVVIDSEPVHERTLIIASEFLGHQLTHTELMQLKGMNQEASAAALRSMASRNDRDCSEIIQIRAKAFAKLVENVRLMPGVVKFIHRLRNAGFSAALTTSSGGADLRLIFDRFGLSRFFEVVVTGDQVTHCKPHPQPYRLTAQRLGIPPDHCLAIEDSVNGIISATAAGCLAIGLTTSFPKRKLIEAGAILTVDTFEELDGMMFSSSATQVADSGLSRIPLHKMESW